MHLVRVTIMLIDHVGSANVNIMEIPNNCSETRIRVETTDPYMNTYNIRMQLFDGSYSEWVEILVEI